MNNQIFCYSSAKGHRWYGSQNPQLSSRYSRSQEQSWTASLLWTSVMSFIIFIPKFLKAQCLSVTISISPGPWYIFPVAQYCATICCILPTYKWHLAQILLITIVICTSYIYVCVCVVLSNLKTIIKIWFNIWFELTKNLSILSIHKSQFVISLVSKPNSAWFLFQLINSSIIL